jgi:hypothetical protein
MTVNPVTGEIYIGNRTVQPAIPGNEAGRTDVFDATGKKEYSFPTATNVIKMVVY